MHGLNSRQVADCKFSYCIPIHGYNRPILEALLIALNYAFFIMAWLLLQILIRNLVLTEKVRDFIKAVFFCVIACPIAGTLSYKIRKFQWSQVPTYDHNICDVLCRECCWHWLCIVSNILGCAYAIIWVLVIGLRFSHWEEHQWAAHEYEFDESKADNQIMLTLTAISAVMHVYYGLFVASYQTAAYYRLKKYNISVSDQVRHQDQEVANEARMMQPLQNQGTNYSGGMPEHQIGYDGGYHSKITPRQGDKFFQNSFFVHA
jgi:hypothetical protein